VDPRTNAEWYRRQVGPFLDEAEASLQLGLDGSALRDLIASKRVIALLWDGRLVFPQWQFNENGEPLPLIRKVIEAFDGAATMFQVAAWLKTPQPFLEDVPPMRWQEMGLPEDALLAAARKRADLMRSQRAPQPQQR
jgi:hypothetical protein